MKQQNMQITFVKRLNKDTEVIFVTKGIETAHRQAKSKAGDKNVGIFGGANIAQQYLKSGLIDEIRMTILVSILSLS